MLADDIAKLMSLIPMEEQTKRNEGMDKIEGGAFNEVMNKKGPFGYKMGEGVNAGVGEPDWVVEKDRHKYDQIFDGLGPVDGKVSGAGECSSITPSQQYLLTFYRIHFQPRSRR